MCESLFVLLNVTAAKQSLSNVILILFTIHLVSLVGGCSDYSPVQRGGSFLHTLEERKQNACQYA